MSFEDIEYIEDATGGSVAAISDLKGVVCMSYKDKVTGHDVQEILDMNPPVPYERICKVYDQASASSQDNEIPLGAVYIFGFICGMMAERKGTADNQAG